MDNNEQVLSRLREDILLRGLSKNTLDSYTLNARIFLTYCNRPVHELDVEDIRKFLQYLIHEKNLHLEP
ncbi:phage integrase N-terminal SAM-like domain-containing protein [Paenibacillus koleovorans]|uniref:phage integrase N-terminal SAM-like domain-containing protein n=1 Tax=Paenibacillus koleovorans TaxID=121608 RepID=UPI001C3F9984